VPGQGALAVLFGLPFHLRGERLGVASGARRAGAVRRPRRRVRPGRCTRAARIRAHPRARGIEARDLTRCRRGSLGSRITRAEQDRRVAVYAVRPGCGPAAVTRGAGAGTRRLKRSGGRSLARAQAAGPAAPARRVRASRLPSLRFRSDPRTGTPPRSLLPAAAPITKAATWEWASALPPRGCADLMVAAASARSARRMLDRVCERAADAPADVAKLGPGERRCRRGPPGTLQSRRVSDRHAAIAVHVTALAGVSDPVRVRARPHAADVALIRAGGWRGGRPGRGRPPWRRRGGRPR
jgi:hypothetical protein